MTIIRFRATAAPARKPGLRHSEYPVEQLARSRSTRFHVGFARMTMHLLPCVDDAVFEACDEGLRVLAASETALELPRRLIRQIHDTDVEFGEPRVRLLYGDTVLEPVMWVVARAPRVRTDAVVHDLIQRGAELADVDWLAPAPRVQARVPLRCVMGYGERFAAVAGRTAELRMSLSHYARLVDRGSRT